MAADRGAAGVKKAPLYDVAIVGAGFAGLYLLHRCRQLGLSARVWEAGGGVGGTWYWNRYPGARCDIESMQYSYQFDDALQQEWNWSERYAPQPEILRYAQHVAERFGLLDGIDFDRRVAAARYDEGGAVWTLTAAGGETLAARFCVMATGCLSAPNMPPLAGREAYKGEIHHTARWPHAGVNFHSKRVAVIGTGSSGIQAIPLIAAEARQLTVFQRTPGYSVPAHNRPLRAADVAAVKADYAGLRARAAQTHLGIEGHYNAASALSVSEEERLAEYERRWQNGGLLFMQSYGDFLTSKAANDTLADFARGKIRNIVKDPKVAEMLCPQNIIGAKRVCVDTNYYAAYNRDNVRLIDARREPIETLNETGLKAGAAQHDVDIIVMATGFDAMTGALTRIDIRGRGGAALREKWRDGPSSYLGLAMADFPNLFTITGPGSPSVLSNMITSIEQHVEWITDFLAYLRDHNFTTAEATAAAEQTWWRHVQEVGKSGLKHTADSWYVGANIAGKARVFLPYNGGLPAYRQKCEAVAAGGYEGFALGRA